MYMATCQNSLVPILLNMIISPNTGSFSFFMYLIGAKGFFLSIAVVAGSLSIFLKIKFIHKKPPKTEQQFVSMPSTTPVAAELDPRATTAPTKEKNIKTTNNFG